MSTEPSEDPRVAAFCSPHHPEPFHAFAYSNDIWKADPFDVESIHADARDRFQRIVNRVLEPTGLSSGRILLLLGDSGSGKTHLMRAFRNHIHSRHKGYCGYMQMTAFTGQYGRYVLNNLIDSLDKPYYEPESGTTGLMRLATGLAESIRAVPPAWVDQLREGGQDQESLDRIVNDMADKILLDDRFRTIDVYLIQALLYLLCDDPRIKARVLKYLRCEDLTPHDRQLLGGIVPCTYPDAPHWVIERLGRVMWAVENVPMLLYVDQLEDVFDLDDAPLKFRRAMATLCDLVSRLPSVVVVISCLSDYYNELKKSLARSTKDRIENDPRPVDLQTPCNREEVVSLIDRRLRFLFEKAGAPVEPNESTFPIPEALVSRLVGFRARDVLLECKLYHDRCIEEGKMADYPSQDRDDPEKARKTIDVERTIIEVEQAWNGFRSAYSPVVPVEETELAGILTEAIKGCTNEADGGRTFEADADGRFIQVEGHAPDHGVDRILVGVCNKAPQGGHLGKQIEELMHRAAEHTAVVVRSTAYPVSPRAAVSQLIARLITGGGRRVVVEDSDWRTMLAFGAFQKKQGADQGFLSWQKETRPLTTLRSIRTILDLDEPGTAKPGRISDPPAPAPTPTPASGPVVSPPPGPAAEGSTRGIPAWGNGKGKVPASRGTTLLAPLAIGTTSDRRGEPLAIDPSELTRHAAFLGAPGSGKTTLALGIVEQLLLQGIPAILVDRKGDLCSYARPGMGLRDGLDGPLAGRADRLRTEIEVALYTPRRSDGRPLSIAAAPAGLGALPSLERQQSSRFAATALAGMMNYGTRQGDQPRLAILTRAIDLLSQESPKGPVRVEALIQFIDEKDPSLINEVGRLDVRLFERLVQDLETLRLNHGDLLEAEGEPLEIEALLGLGPHAPTGKTRLSIISTKFLGNNQDVQFWVAQFLMEVGRWIGRSPAPDGALQAILMFDEADLYLPAVRQPASKEPMEHLLRRARSAGLGLLLATQSPGDFDYRCRDNIRTWFVGQVKEANSLAKMKPMLNECRVDVAAPLPAQTTGEFHLIRDGQVTGLHADRSAVDARQVSEEEILGLARLSRESPA